MRYHAEGFLSFVKGCDIFGFDTINSDDSDSAQAFLSYPILSYEFSRSYLIQWTNKPSVYTKLSCYLPWVADQYGLEYRTEDTSDTACTQGHGEISTEGNCTTTLSEDLDV